MFLKDDVCTIMDKPPSRQLIAKVHMTRNKMFTLKMRPNLKEEGVVAIAIKEIFQEEVKDENLLWHLQFRYLNFRGLNLLHRKCMVKGLPLIEKQESLCEGCILGK